MFTTWHVSHSVFQITIGRTRRSVNQGERVEQVDDHTADLVAGSFVAVNLANWSKTPVIGKITAIGDETFTIHYWKGSYNSEWQPDLYRARGNQPVPWLQELPKTAIILANFELSDKSRLLRGTKKYLKNSYMELQQQVTE